MKREELVELNLYKLLELPFNASSEQIQSSFKSRVRNVHPDKNVGKNHEDFILLKAARDALLDQG